jgi:formate hydrogenlyase subunit 3/multisubunit Na+/H+ antiporter MnhD subunit
VYRWLGTATVVLGGVSALAQRRWGYLVGCAILVDWGAGLVALGQGSAQSAVWMAEMLFWRALSLLLVGAGLTVVLRASGLDDDIAGSGGLLRARPLAVLALIGGLLSLGGFPLTPGFLGRGALIGNLFSTHPETAWIVIAAGVGVCLGAVRGLVACMGPAPEGFDARPLPELLGTAVSALVLWLVGTLMLHPGPWLELAARALGSTPLLP